VIATVHTERSQVGREVIAALLSGAILVTTTWAFMRTFESGSLIFAGDSALAAREAYERQKDLLLLATGLLGTVIGYYLGRVPAELRASKAQSAADKARAELSSVNSLLAQAATTATAATQDRERIRQEVRVAAESALRALKEQSTSADAARSTEALEARRGLNELLRRL
jgi:hypothetical protein